MASADVVTPPVDLEAGEATPLLSSTTKTEEPPPLQDIKAESLKEKTVSAVAGVNCKYDALLRFRVESRREWNGWTTLTKNMCFWCVRGWMVHAIGMIFLVGVCI